MLVAITGGIGCGKSLVSQLLNIMGYTVYDCDSNAKRLMLTDPELRRGLIGLFGKETYLADGSLNKKHLSSSIFGNSDALDSMNSLIHPAVARDLLNIYKDSKEILFYESAILYESGFDKLAIPDFVISVSSPLELRISRVMTRDHTSRDLVLNRIESQFQQEYKDNRADFIIHNDDSNSVIRQTEECIMKLKV